MAVRAVELAALMLLGLVAFRALVWGRAVETARGLSGRERDSALRDGQRLFWRAFWALTVVAGGGRSRRRRSRASAASRCGRWS